LKNDAEKPLGPEAFWLARDFKAPSIPLIVTTSHCIELSALDTLLKIRGNEIFIDAAGPVHL